MNSIYGAGINENIGKRQDSEVIQAEMLSRMREWFPNSKYVFMGEISPYYLVSEVFIADSVKAML